jgi:AAA15 family ATPase/GTPase
MNLVSNIHISNFKSIQNIELEDCRRINLFIGKPNVGKSNIMEALTLFGLLHSEHLHHNEFQNFLTSIRVDNVTELLFNGDTTRKIELAAGNDHLVATFHEHYPSAIFNPLVGEERWISTDNGYISFIPSAHSEREIRSYYFRTPFSFAHSTATFLQPPTGCNLFQILNSLPELKSEISEMLDEYGLKLVFDQNSKEIKFWKQLSHGEIYIVPFHSIADTLQRIIFYKAAIASNQNAIITFEEPEAHAYPPYIAKITGDIIHSATNQFFITTHSPYIVNDFIEADRSEMAIFLVDYQNGATIVKRIKDEDLSQVYEFGIDLFFNTSMFLK